MESSGLPPRWRGKVSAGSSAALSFRIPPCVGGEKKTATTAPHGSTGSPPRRRGKGSRCRTLQHRHRITPAWAGKRRFCSKTHLLTADHPRVGREKARTLIVQDEPQGSPPRRRGKGIQLTHKGLLDGITPAWAGKRNWAIGSRLLNWDHPRTGGEKGSYRWVIKSVKGSPPHKRGKVDVLFGGLVDGRITPAWAGKSA